MGTHQPSPSTVSQPTPLTLVSGAVAGDDLERVARSAAEALGHPVAIVLPSLGAPVTWPAEAIPGGLLGELVEYASAASDAAVNVGEARRPVGVVRAVPVRIGSDVVGVVAELDPSSTNGDPAANLPPPASDADAQAWLEAVAAAAAVTRLMHEGHDAEDGGAALGFLRALVAGPPRDVAQVVTEARRLGLDLGAGAVAVCARGSVGPPGVYVEWPSRVLVAELAQGVWVALMSLAAGGSEPAAAAVGDALQAAGFEVGVSSPRRQPALMHEALREAMLLAALAGSPEAALAEHEETYRLLIGVLLRDPEELEQLRSRTISPLIAYDAEHDTELLVTLGTFLAHHGSTTETAEAMQLHRHTVGYRLSRVHEVSGLSPYETDGRERLSLGLKAAHILEAHQRLSKPG